MSHDEDSEQRIAQIIPATGWGARYKEDAPDEWLEPIMCFALVESKCGDFLTRRVRAMAADGDFVDSARNFERLMYAPHRLSPE